MAVYQATRQTNFAPTERGGHTQCCLSVCLSDGGECLHTLSVISLHMQRVQLLLINKHANACLHAAHKGLVENMFMFSDVT